jgi:hypothetical protein
MVSAHANSLCIQSVHEACLISPEVRYTAGPPLVTCLSDGAGIEHEGTFKGWNLTISGNSLSATGGPLIQTTYGGGAGICVWGPYAHLINSRVHDNSITVSTYAEAYGAGVYWATLDNPPLQGLMHNVTISRNHIVVNASGDSTGQGAGVYVWGSISLRDCTIQDNRASLGDVFASFPVKLQGGGLYVAQDLSMVACNVTSNRLIAAPTLDMLGRADALFHKSFIEVWSTHIYTHIYVCVYIVICVKYMY